MSLYGGVTIPGEPDLDNIRKLDLLPMRSIHEMMRYGMAVDIERLADITEQLKSEMAELRIQICSEIPENKLDEFIAKSNLDAEDDYLPMNVESTKQMRKLLFETLGVGLGKQLKITRSGDISTGKRQLETHKQDHPVVQLVLNYRERAKLCNTYSAKLPTIARFHPHKDCWCGLKHFAPTWRVHCDIMTTRTSTGRPACVACWTKILTRRGYVQVKDIQVGDEVWTHRLRWRRVKATVIKPESPMYDVRFSNGDLLTCTKDHRLLVYDNEHIEALVKESGEYREGIGTVSQRRISDIARDRGRAWDHIPHGSLGLQPQDAKSGIQGTIGDSIRTIKDSREESDVWQDWGTAPQLDRFGGRWTRISDLLEEPRTTICPSSRHGRIVGIGEIARRIGSTSHRRRPKKQQAGQSGLSNKSRAQDDPQATAERRAIYYVEEIAPTGCFEVFDIQVEEDESYFACGVFSHNTKNPNLQNIPVRSKTGQAIRACFVASPGTKLVTVDFSQLELRRLAHLGRVKRMIEVFHNDEDIHLATACVAFNEPDPKKIDKITQRAPAKNVNFAVVYGETPKGLLDQLVSDTYGKSGIPVPDWLTLQWCEEFMRTWFQIYPEVPDYMDLQKYRARRYRCVWTEFGRIRRMPQVRSEHKRIVAEGDRMAGNQPIQGGGADMLKLAQGELQDWIEKEIRSLGVWCWPLNEVHDELIFEVQDGWEDIVLAKMIDVMSNVLVDKDTGENYCRVPIKAEGQAMERWEKS